jgi:hypothetical protein
VSRFPALNTRSVISVCAIGVAAFAVVALLRFWPPFSGSLYPRCLFRTLSGLYCPGCGSTRALYSLASGDVLQALRCNALLVLGLPLLGVAMLCRRSSRQPARSVASSVGWIALAVILAWFVLRNLPFADRDWLVPPQLIEPADTTEMTG